MIGAFHNVLLMKTPIPLSNALLSKATRWQKLYSYWLAKATRCFLKQRVVATRNDPFGLRIAPTVVGSRKSLSPRIKSSNDDFYTNRRSDKFSITYPKSAEIHFGEKYLSLFKKKTYFVGKIHNLQIFPMAHQHLYARIRSAPVYACAQVVNAWRIKSKRVSVAYTAWTICLRGKLALK